LKKLVTLSFVLLALGAFGQKNIHLQINHKLGAQAFALNQGASNNLGHDFNVTRLQYYISSIALVHDGGIVTPVADTYILVNAADSTFELLGTFNITTLEAVRFGIGVDLAKNHLDPAAYPANHPLAPKSPSMHWGWAGGYRFVAMEGKGGNSFANLYEFHALDDAVYFVQTLPTVGITNGNDLIVSIIADYTQALYEIPVANGNITHGSSGPALTLLQNFNWRVFTSSEGNAAMALNELDNAKNISIRPNPTNGNAVVHAHNLPENAQVLVADVAGKQRLVSVANGHVDVSALPAGIYILSIVQQGEILQTDKLIITQ
jgi:hypothetical protein